MQKPSLLSIRLWDIRGGKWNHKLSDRWAALISFCLYIIHQEGRSIDISKLTPFFLLNQLFPTCYSSSPQTIFPQSAQDRKSTCSLSACDAVWISVLSPAWIFIIPWTQPDLFTNYCVCVKTSPRCYLCMLPSNQLEQTPQKRWVWLVVPEDKKLSIVLLNWPSPLPNHLTPCF